MVFTVVSPERDESLDEEALFLELQDETISFSRKQEIVGLLYNNNLRLVHHAIKKWFGHSFLYTCQKHHMIPDDFLSIGSDHLLHCIHRFEPQRGFKFATFAMTCLTRLYVNFHRQEDRRTSDQSLDKTVGISDQGTPITLSDLIPLKDEFTLRIENRDLAHYVILELTYRLSERDFLIFSKYLEGMKQRALADHFGLSQSIISRIISKSTKVARQIYLESIEEAVPV